MTEYARSGPSGLELPASLFKALGSPRRLALAPADGGNLAVRPESRVHALVRRLPVPALRGAWSDRASLSRAAGPVVEYATSRPLPEATFGIANYETFVFLIPVSRDSDRASREQSWSAIQDYHEHRPPGHQDETARQVSDWLARDVLAPLSARSFLELGCGAGRNLLALSRTSPVASLRGLDINAAAVEEARRTVPTATIDHGSLYELARHEDGAIDVVFTSGVLMHIPPSELAGVVREMHRIAARAVVHFELHGPSHAFDFHRYPRDYAALYAALGLPVARYETFPRGDFRSATPAFQHALLVSE